MTYKHHITSHVSHSNMTRLQDLGLRLHRMWLSHICLVSLSLRSSAALALGLALPRAHATELVF